MKTLLAALLLVTGCAAAHTATPPTGTLMDVSVLDRSTGQRLPIWRHHGRLYVVGTPGSRYAVQLANRSGGRLMSVLSVDGINVVSGESAATSQSGYVLDAGQSADIAGWRKNMAEVAAFYFTSVADSYAGRTGRPANTGVIGIAVFREEQPLPVAALPSVAGRASQERQNDAAAPAPATVAAAAPEAMAKAASGERADAADRSGAAGALARAKKLGTGHGERVSAPTEYTAFQRASTTPAEIITLYYDSRANLIARGIIPVPRQPAQPNPFPGSFVPDPQG